MKNVGSKSQAARPPTGRNTLCQAADSPAERLKGTFWKCNGKSIGSGSEGVDSSLQEQYNKNLTLKKAETVALSILKQVMKEKSVFTGQKYVYLDTYQYPSGTFWKCNGKAIGSGSKGADSSLQEQYNKDLTLKEAETIALSILKQVMEEKVTSNNVDIAKVAHTYHLYAPAEFGLWWNGTWILEPKREWVGRGVKEKSLNRNKKNTVTGTSLTTESDRILNDDTLVVDASAAKEFVSPSVVDMNVEKDKRSPLVENTNTVITVKSIRAISEWFVNIVYGFLLGKQVAYPVVANYVKNTWGKFGLVKSMLNSSTGLFSFQFSSIDGLNLMLENGLWFIRNHSLILRKWNPNVDLLKEDGGNVPVWVKLHGVPITAFSEVGLSAIATKLGTPLMLDSYTSAMCLQSWGRSSYARAMIELRADVELKDTIVVDMPKIMGKGYYTCTVRVEYEWKPPRCSCCKIFGHTQEECPMNTGLGVARNVKKPSQTSRVVSVGSKMGFKPHKEYRHVPKKPTASASRNKKKDVEPTNEVSNSNPFEVRNSVDNDVELGTNGGTTNLVNNGANLSGSSFMNVDNGSTSTTPVSDKIKKFEDSLIDGQAILVDKAGSPLKKVEYPGDYDSEDDVASVENNMARSMVSERVGFGTQSLLEQ
nr:hypothetical protein [Tanacetum cinerariifolium]